MASKRKELRVSEQEWRGSKGRHRREPRQEKKSLPVLTALKWVAAGVVLMVVLTVLFSSKQVCEASGAPASYCVD